VHRAATLEGLPGVERELKAIAFAALREISDPDRELHDQPRAKKSRQTRAAS
jgi:hypothetical protein